MHFVRRAVDFALRSVHGGFKARHFDALPVISVCRSLDLFPVAASLRLFHRLSELRKFRLCVIILARKQRDLFFIGFNGTRQKLVPLGGFLLGVAHALHGFSR